MITKVLKSRPTNMLRKLLPLIIMLAFAATSHTSIASTGENSLTWQPVQHIPFYDDNASTPIMIADGDTVHAFNSTQAGNQLAVIYSSWKPVEGWSAPVDIVLSPEAQQARLGGVQLDRHGTFHMVFFGGNDLRASIYYTQASVDNVREANAWSDVEAVGRQAITPDLSSIISTADDELFIIYSGNSDGQGLYYTRSLDLGQSWSPPNLLFQTYSASLWPDNLTQMTDSQNRVHLAWAVADTTGNGQAIYYTNFDNAAEEWKQPVRLAEAFGFEADTPLLFEHNAELFIIYHNDVPTTRWMRRSSDYGETWTEPVKIHPDHVGSNGPPSAIIDSTNQLHLFFGNRTGANIHGLWHMTWDDTTWSTPQPVVSGIGIQDTIGGRGFDPSDATAVLVQDHTILLTWTTDPGAGLNGVWYTYAALDTPLVVDEETNNDREETVETIETGTPVAVEPADLTTPAPEFETSAVAETSESRINTLAFGLIPVLILISAVFITSVVRARRLQ